MAENDSINTRPLPVVRALIDSLDHDLLGLLGRRNALVAEIAQFKRENRVPIRDYARESPANKVSLDSTTGVGSRWIRAAMNASPLPVGSQ